MKKIYLIETCPINKEFFTCFYSGFVNTTKDIEDAQNFKNYDDAQKRLQDIVLGGFDSKKTLYLSIVSFTIKQN
jgi:hypothetical protein